ncbi:MAG: UDP-glucose 4-epimerase GalE [Xanthomonadales bacterium]|uniref:UDP-glucose 4-epimerase GalE n=1 Tax=Hydrogenophaga sp. TaxID=1904254 RepID=UPI0016BA7028|nr:UDP-glucose 4-epimerase GalE [Hydrogenophaga sp.]NIM71380.1 UDP-glucose 4-epimerase GalE [Xanthomonadales bacterium]NIN32299.1 UDP-glucose 4-epimerase GalE [Hydrogenophaga sp.]NIN60539.1 UDP-glucose 4-epimerase GalE [Xanthomonadales bacterium]NIN75891.1 UDP-glucose 4-epimerase GalE [Xanthomonadales bacterium]NIO13029.1 UDP-glucose 4-epimerase GalE [Xanthomonadales bacterium]
MNAEAETILVTGGAGYIGTHTCVELLAAGYRVVAVDNLCNSKASALDRVAEITGKSIAFVKADLLEQAALEQVFAEHRPACVIHFAGLKAVGESTEQPLRYFHNNVGGTISLLQAMDAAGVRKIVFSSSCTVYGQPDRLPIGEDAPLRTTNPYGATKLMIEDLLRALHANSPEWQVSLLRYFNPVGAHESGLIGEDPNGIPDNLVPYIQQVALGRQEFLRVWGDDYPTHDGTGVRDYLHVTDLANGHLCALQKLAEAPGLITHNLGTGRGYSVLDVLHAFERACGRELPYRVLERRPGDIAETWADPTRAREELGWKAERSLEDMCRDAWNWAQNNPEGYP